MKPKNIITILSIAVIIGFIVSFVISSDYIISNRYIQYKMFRLATFTFQKNLNILVLCCLAVLFALYCFWFLVVEKLKCDKDKVISVIIILAALLPIIWWLNNLTEYTLPLALKRFVTKIADLWAGKISFNHFLSLLKKRFAFIALLSAALIGIPLLFWLLTRLNWGKFLKIIKTRYAGKTGYIRKAAFALAVFLLVLNLGIFIDSKTNAPKGPNVVILLIDALRRDHVGAYGYHRDTSPNIDRFSQDAVIFQDAVSQCSWTTPSVTSLFSCLYPSTHGVISHSMGSTGNYKTNILSYKIATLAEVMKDKGYTTAAFVANRWTSKKLRFDQGFDVFDTINSKVKKVFASELNAKALPWLRKNKNKPFFAYLHYMDVHGPYIPPEPYDSFFNSTQDRQMTEEEASILGYLSVGREIDKNNLNYYIDLYDGAIRYTDYHIKQVLEAIKEYDSLDNTIIVITADHGEAFFEHGFCDHGWTLYNEEINIPLIVKFPKSIKVQNSKQGKVELIDITATILNILNCKFPYNTNGRDLLNVSSDKILGKSAIFSEELSEETKGPPKIAMIKDGFKAIYMVTEQKATELYDLGKDKLEKNNIIGVYPDKSRQFEREIIAWQKEIILQKGKIGLPKESVAIIDNQRELEQLKSLGYVQ